MNETKSDNLTINLKRKPTSLWRNIFRSFIRNRTAVFGVFIILLFTLCAIFAPLITVDINPDNNRPAYEEMDFDSPKLPPSLTHLAGTDDRGRDSGNQATDDHEIGPPSRDERKEFSGRLFKSKKQIQNIYSSPL